MHRGNATARTANSKRLLPNRTREPHHHREKIQHPDQFLVPKEQHLPQSEVPHLNRLPVPAEPPYVQLFWDISPDSPNTNRDTRHRRSACQGQSHQSSQRQQSLPTSGRHPLTFDDTDADDIMRDGSQHLFYQVIILCICAAEVYRCYAPIKRVVPLFHSIITPVKTRSRQGRSTSIHPTGNTARWGAYRPAMSGVPLSVMAQAREDQPAQQTAAQSV